MAQGSNMTAMPRSIFALVVAMALWRQLAPQTVPSAAVGAASVTADLSECARATSVRLWWTGPTNPPPPFVIRDRPTWSLHPVIGFEQSLVWVTDQTPTPCRWMFSALPPGPYVVALEGPQGSGGAQAFDVVAGRTADVAVPPPTVTVSGRTRFNGRPMPRTLVQFARSPGRDGVAPFGVVRSDADGRYTLVLDRPGEFRYRIFFLDGSMTEPQEMGPVTLQAERVGRLGERHGDSSDRPWLGRLDAHHNSIRADGVRPDAARRAEG